MEEIVFYIIMLVVAGVISAVSNKNKQEKQKEALRQRQQPQQKSASSGPVLNWDIPKQSSQTAVKIDCPRCSFPNAASKTFCIHCGQRLAEAPNAPADSSAHPEPLIKDERDAENISASILKTNIEKQEIRNARRSSGKAVQRRKALSERLEYTTEKKPEYITAGQKPSVSPVVHSPSSQASLEIRSLILGNPEKLKQAFVLKEILDKPMALRRYRR